MTIDEWHRILGANLDSWGFPVHLNDSDGGGGDSTQRLGMIYSCLTPSVWLWSEAGLRLRQVQDPNDPSNFARHPNRAQWYGNFDTMSRDQWVGIVATVANARVHSLAGPILCGTLKRWLFMTNTRAIHDTSGKNKLPDIVLNPSHWAVLARAQRGRFFLAIPLKRLVLELFFWPVVLLGDLAQCFNSWFRVRQTMRDVALGGPDYDSGDCLNHMLCLLVQKRHCETALGRWARLYYMRNRAEIPGHGPGGPESALRHYFRHEGAPKIDKLWEAAGLFEELRA